MIVAKFDGSKMGQDEHNQASTFQNFNNQRQRSTWSLSTMTTTVQTFNSYRIRLATVQDAWKARVGYSGMMKI